MLSRRRSATSTAPEALATLVEYLQTPAGLKLYKTAYRENMQYKIDQYTKLRDDAMEDVTAQSQLAWLKMAELRKLAQVCDDGNNWQIFESISSVLRDAEERAALFEELRRRAEQTLAAPGMGGDAVQSHDAIKHLRDVLVASLQQLARFESQAHIVTHIAHLVGSFLKTPALFRTKMMNFMLVGGAGTGKSSVAEAIGDVLAKAGIFVGNRLVVAGRAELVASYEGQTVSKTRAFLTSHLDGGVIFIDEAYAITPWHHGQPEGYGSEAATAMVEFMSRYTGLYCIIVAGYEHEMQRQFLPTNEGLDRRFPYKFVLRNMTPDELVVVFKRQLMRKQGEPEDVDEATSYFHADAWVYLRGLIAECMRGRVAYEDRDDPATGKWYRNVRVFHPDHPRMYTLFHHQAGSMTNLADDALGVLINTLTFDQVSAAKRGMTRPVLYNQDQDVMRAVILQRIDNTALSEVDDYMADFVRVERLLAPPFSMKLTRHSRKQSNGQKKRAPQANHSAAGASASSVCMS